MSIETFVQRFAEATQLDDGSFLRLMYYRAVVAIGDCTKHGECWVYPRTNAAGYGVVRIGGKQTTPSRLILCCATQKPLDYEMDACHTTPLCRSKACCNPEHLFWDTHAENCKRRELERRARATFSEMAGHLVAGSTALSA